MKSWSAKQTKNKLQISATNWYKCNNSLGINCAQSIVMFVSVAIRLQRSLGVMNDFSIKFYDSIHSPLEMRIILMNWCRSIENDFSVRKNNMFVNLARQFCSFFNQSIDWSPIEFETYVKRSPFLLLMTIYYFHIEHERNWIEKKNPF